jgi:cellulose synthase (UDP-forming)
MAVLVLSTFVGFIKLYLGVAPSVEGTWLNVVWVAIDLLWMSVVFRAASYRGFEAPAP